MIREALNARRWSRALPRGLCSTFGQRLSALRRRTALPSLARWRPLALRPAIADDEIGQKLRRRGGRLRAETGSVAADGESGARNTGISRTSEANETVAATSWKPA